MWRDSNKSRSLFSGKNKHVENGFTEPVEGTGKFFCFWQGHFQFALFTTSLVVSGNMTVVTTNHIVGKRPPLNLNQLQPEPIPRPGNIYIPFYVTTRQAPVREISVKQLHSEPFTMQSLAVFWDCMRIRQAQCAPKWLTTALNANVDHDRTVFFFNIKIHNLSLVTFLLTTTDLRILELLFEYCLGGNTGTFFSTEFEMSSTAPKEKRR